MIHVKAAASCRTPKASPPEYYAALADAAGTIGFIALWYDTLSKFIRGHLCTPTVFADSGFSA
jgi:hypothetical protein